MDSLHLARLLLAAALSARAAGDFDEAKHPRDEKGKFTDGDGSSTTTGISADHATDMLQRASEGTIHEGRESPLEAQPGKYYRGLGFDSISGAHAFLTTGDLTGRGVYGETTFFSPNPEYSTTYMRGKVGLLFEVDLTGVATRQSRSDTVTTKERVRIDRVTRIGIIVAQPESSLWGAYTKSVVTLRQHRGATMRGR